MKVLLVVASLLIFAEAGTRLWLFLGERNEGQKAAGYRGYPGGLFEPDAELGFRYTHGFRGTFLHPSYHGIELEISGKGTRVTGTGGIRPGAELLAMVGDSVTFGPGVGDQETFSSLLDGSVRRGEKTLTVRNWGVNSYGLAQLHRWTLRLAPQVPECKAVCLVLNLNDLEPIFVPGYIEAAFRDRGLDVPRGLEAPRTAIPRERPGAIERTLRRSAFVNELRQAIRRHQVRSGKIATQTRRYFDRLLERWQGDEGERFFRALASFRSDLTRLGLDLIVLFPPYAYQWDEGPGSSLLEPQRRVAQWCESENVPFLDPRVDMAAVEVREDLLLPGDPQHLSRSGHRWLATWLREQLPRALQSL